MNTSIQLLGLASKLPLMDSVNIMILGNQMGDEGTKNIAEALKFNSSLQILDLESKITMF